MSDDIVKSAHELLENQYAHDLEIRSLQDENKEYLTKINNRKLKSQFEKIKRNDEIQEGLTKESILNRKANVDKMIQDLEDRKKAVFFIDETLTKDVVIAPHSLAVMCAMTGHGKSTATAQISEPIITKLGKKVLILSNEEKPEDVRARVSCLRTGVSFGDYKNNKCTTEEERKVIIDSKVIEDKLIVIGNDNELDTYLTTNVEGVASVFKTLDSEIGIVIIDYIQNIAESNTGSIEPWHCNNEIARHLNTIKNSSEFPIIVMAQCESEKKGDKKEDNEPSHPVYRWVGGKQILRYATDIIEIIRNYDQSTTIFYSHKQRFMHSDTERNHVFGFDKKMQRYVEYNAEFDIAVTAQKFTRANKDRALDLGLDKISEK